MCVADAVTSSPALTLVTPPTLHLCVKVAEVSEGQHSSSGCVPTPSTQRWVPPTAREQVDPMQTLFRKMRGILNKITPDNFDKLSYELTQLPVVNTKEALKGVILLVYEKALEESQYTYMYAQLCRRLNELVPNFEEPGSQSTTFRKLLLHKCQEEFENRRVAFERRESVGCDEEVRGMAKRKMLGNIKFVGELFKIGVLHEAIIHSCIKELLERRRGNSISETVENVECLCQFMTTVGGRLDTTRAKGWMDKYFERMHSLMTNPDLPRRIHFMLLDVQELRANKWQPRRVTSTQGPRPLHTIRQEVYQDTPTPPPPPFTGPGYAPPPPFPVMRGGSADEGFLMSPSDAPHMLSPQDPLSMVFPVPPTPHTHEHPIKGGESNKTEKKQLPKLPKTKTDNSVSLRPTISGLKPSSKIPSYDMSHDLNEGDSGREKVVKRVERLPRTRDDSSDDDDNDVAGVTDPQSVGVVPRPYVPPGYLPPLYPPPGPMYPLTNIPPRPMMYPPGLPPGHPRPPPGHSGPPPGFCIPPGPPAPPVRPPLGGVPVRPRFYHPHGLTPPYAPYQPRYGPPPGWTPPDRPHPPSEPIDTPLPAHLERNESVKVKYLSSKPPRKTVSAKKASKNEHEEAVEPLIGQLLKSRDIDGAVSTVRDLTFVPRDTLTTLVITQTLGKSEDDRTRVSQLVQQLHSEQLITSEDFVQAVGRVLSSAGDYETSLPQYKMYLAGFIARAIAHDVVEFTAMTTTFTGGAHHPTLLVVLQALTNLLGEERVTDRVRGVKLGPLLPVEYRSHEAITELLESKKLIFLYPLRRIQSELSAKLRQPDITALAVYRWIKTNVDSSHYTTPEFIMVLTSCILDYVCGETTLSTSDQPSKTIVAQEKQFMEKFKVLLERFVSDDHDLQVTTLYASQTFCHQHNFPKGLVLRLFSYLYNMDVVEEEALLHWREDLSQEFPGKGKALFQVHQWLVLLEEADSSEDDS